LYICCKNRIMSVN